MVSDSQLRNSSSYGGIFFFLLILLQPAVASAREPKAALASSVVQTPISRPFCVGSPSQLLVTAPLLAEGWKWRNLFSGLGSRTNMVRFVTIGMAIGLYIMMRK